MTPSQLRQWSIQNSQPDQWWLSLDAVTEELPVSVSEIERLLASGEYGQAQVLHVSQAALPNPPWINLAVPAVMPPPPTMESAIATLAAANEQAKTGGSVAKPLSPNSGKTAPVEATVQHFFIGMGALLFVCFLMFKVTTCGDSAGRKPQQADESDVSSPNPSGEYTITGDNFTGFANREDEERASEFGSDTEAFSKLFLASVMTKRATLFKKGETVILEEFGGFLDSKVKLRRKGEIVGYWTNREAID